MKNIELLTNNGVNIEKSLEIFGDIETYNDTLTVFLNEVENKLSKIKHYKQIADMANYAILVHSLKSDAMYFGFEKLSELSYQHEMESKQNNIYYVSEKYEELESEASRIIDLVKVYVGLKEELADKTEILEPINKKSILVVDDSDVIRNYLHRLFNKDYKVLVAKDGGEAIDFIKNDDSIVTVLLDLNMPEIDGFAVLAFLKEQNLFERLPVAIITNNDLREIDQRAMQYPIFGIVKKPFNELSIKTVVEKAIEFNS